MESLLSSISERVGPKTVVKFRATLILTILLITSVVSLPAGACGASKWIIHPHQMGNEVVGELRLGAGVACYRNGVTNPPSYLVADIGKRGVPVPSKTDTKAIHERFSQLDPHALRFLYVPLTSPHLVVFLATLQALCDPTQPPFKNLNGACNEYYQPLEYGDRTTAAPDCF